MLNLLREEKKSGFFSLKKLKYERSHVTFLAIRDFLNWNEVVFSRNTLSNKFKSSSFQQQETESLEF